jgi:hypothetical protein
VEARVGAATAGLGWAVGVLRLNAQAVASPSPLPAYVRALAASADDGDVLDRGLAALQPVMAARRAALEANGALECGEGGPGSAEGAAGEENGEGEGEGEASEGKDEGEEDGESEDEDKEEGGLLELEDVFPAAGGLGLFVLESAANHSCDPNTLVAPASWLGPDGRHRLGIELVAGRTIAAGEEVTISYLGDLPADAAAEADADAAVAAAAARAERRALLREQYLFDCSCSRCGPAAGYT